MPILPSKPRPKSNTFGSSIKSRSYSAGSGFRFGFNGKEKQGEISGDNFDFGARIYDGRIGKWFSVDPMASSMPSWSSYNFVFNNPLRFGDPMGLEPKDWVRRNNGSIYWDKKANNKASTKPGETYLGKTLTLKFNSFIDAKLWDGPNPFLLPSPVGSKLTSTINLFGIENNKGELTGIKANMFKEIGTTPVGTPRDNFEGLGDQQNKFSFSQIKNANGTLSTYNLYFEQHASVSPIEQVGLNIMGFDIVNVAQQVNVSLYNNNLTIKGSTDLFPSATLSVNGFQLFKYNQPSFIKTHGITKKQIGARIPRNPLDDGLIPIYYYEHLRPAPAFYSRN